MDGRLRARERERDRKGGQLCHGEPARNIKGMASRRDIQKLSLPAIPNARDSSLRPYLAAQLSNRANVVDQGVGRAVGPADAEHDGV